MSRTASSTTTTFLYDGGRVGLEKQSSTTVHSYGYGTELLQRDGETMQYDGHGDTRTVTNSTQTVTATGNYEAYGALVGGTGSSSTPYQYGGTSGYRTDGDADLVYIGARWYDPVIGHFVSADSDAGSPSDPATENHYTYCGADLVNRLDPTGNYYDIFGADGPGDGLGFPGGGPPHGPFPPVPKKPGPGDPIPSNVPPVHGIKLGDGKPWGGTLGAVGGVPPTGVAIQGIFKTPRWIVEIRATIQEGQGPMIGGGIGLRF